MGAVNDETEIVLVSSIYPEPYSTIYAFIKAFIKTFKSLRYKVELVFRDKKNIRIYIIELIRYILWFLGVRGCTRAYMFSYRLIHAMTYIGLKKYLDRSKERLFIANDVYAGMSLSTLNIKHIQLMHGKTLYEILAENPKLLEHLNALKRMIYYERYSLIKSSKIIIADEKLRDYIKLVVGGEIYRVVRDRIRYVPNIVDVDIFKPRRRIISRKIKVLTHVTSSSTLGKDYAFLKNLLIALKNTVIKKGNIRIMILIAGNVGRIPRNILDEILGLNDELFRVAILGKIPNEAMPIIYSNSDMVINPLSRLVSGISRVSLEAMLCGAVPVTTPEGDVYPLMNNVSGIIVEREPAKAAEKIYSLLAREDVIYRLGREARRVALEYMDRVRREWIREITLHNK